MMVELTSLSSFPESKKDRTALMKLISEAVTVAL